MQSHLRALDVYRAVPWKYTALKKYENADTEYCKIATTTTYKIPHRKLHTKISLQPTSDCQVPCIVVGHVLLRGARDGVMVREQSHRGGQRHHVRHLTPDTGHTLNLDTLFILWSATLLYECLLLLSDVRRVSKKRARRIELEGVQPWTGAASQVEKSLITLHNAPRYRSTF